jgi:hypothetical protein
LASLKSWLPLLERKHNWQFADLLYILNLAPENVLWVNHTRHQDQSSAIDYFRSIGWNLFSDRDYFALIDQQIELVNFPIWQQNLALTN